MKTGQIFRWLGLVALAAAAGAWYFWPRPSPRLDPPAGFARLDPQLRSFLLAKAKAVAAHPRDAARHADLGLVYSANGLWVDAVHSYSNALSLGSREPLVWQYRGAALARMAEPGPAEASLRAAAISRPELASANWHLGQLLLQTGRPAEAAEAFGRVTRADPQDWRGFVGLGQALLQQGRNDDARTPLEKAVALAPRARAPHAVLARALMATGERDRAQREMALGKGADVSPPPDAWTERLRSYQKTVPDQMELAGELEAVGRADEAASLLAEVVRHHPREPMVLNRMALALNQAGKPAEAEFFALQALSVDTNYLPAVVTLSFSLVAAGRMAEGLAAAERAQQLSPQLIQPLLAKANALLAQDKDPEAVLALRAALELEPENADVLTELGNVTWRNLGKPSDGAALFRLANSSDPSSIRPILGLLELYSETGDRVHAAAWLKTLYQLEGASPAFQRWQQRLSKPEGRP